MITTSIEAMLFASAKPTTISAIKKNLDLSDQVLQEAIDDIKQRFNTDNSGIHLIEHDHKLQFVSNPNQSKILAKFLKQEISGELTRPQLETLTIIAYRGPITKPEIEQIRGINCSMIIRNLLMRALIEQKEDKEKLHPVFIVSTKFLRHLGLKQISDLPDYQDLHDNEKITEMIQELAEKNQTE